LKIETSPARFKPGSEEIEISFINDPFSHFQIFTFSNNLPESGICLKYGSSYLVGPKPYYL